MDIKNNKLFQALLKLKVYEYYFYYEFLLGCNIYEDNMQPTMFIKATLRGFEIHYNKFFVDTLTEPQLIFGLIHEIMHGLSNHINRVGERLAYIKVKEDENVVNEQLKQLDKYSLSSQDIEIFKKVLQSKERRVYLFNLTQDMIINRNIIEMIPKNIAEKIHENIPDIPKEYNNKRIYEKLYDWFLEKNKDKIQNENSGSGKGDGKEKDEGFDYQLTDQHAEDEVSPELKQAMVESFIDKQRAKGNVTSNVENMLGLLRPKKNNWISAMKRSLSMLIGKYKKNSWKRISRRIDDEEGLILKGVKRQKFCLNILHDTSGSMYNSHKKVLGWVASNNIECNYIQCDTEVKHVSKLKNIKQFEKIKIHGNGGTILQPMIDLVSEKYNNNCNIMLTDGECETIDTKNIKKDILVFTTNQTVNFTNCNHIKIKQVVIPMDDKE